MDTRLIVVLAVIALLQSLFAKKKGRAGAEAPEDAAEPPGEGLPPGMGERPEGAGAGGRGATDGRWPDIAREEPGARSPSARPAAAGTATVARGGESVARPRRPGVRPRPSPVAGGHGGESVATGPRSRTTQPGPVRAEAAPAGSRGRGRGILAELFAELEAQAKKELPFPGSGRDATPGRGGRADGPEADSSGIAEPGLPSFGVPERAEAERREAADAGRRELRVPPVPPRGDPWALGSTGSAPPARPARATSRQSPEARGAAAPAGAPPVGSGAASPDHDLYGLRNRDSLKRAVVAREVLGPPLALRRGDEGASWR